MSSSLSPLSGKLLATGCMDGVARLWSRDGELKHTLAGHSESIFSLRFDADAKQLLTGSYDRTVAVWDVASGSMGHKFEAHSAQVRARARDARALSRRVDARLGPLSPLFPSLSRMLGI